MRWVDRATTFPIAMSQPSAMLRPRHASAAGTQEEAPQPGTPFNQYLQTKYVDHELALVIQLLCALQSRGAFQLGSFWLLPC